MAAFEIIKKGTFAPFDPHGEGDSKIRIQKETNLQFKHIQNTAIDCILSQLIRLEPSNKNWQYITTKLTYPIA